MADFVVLHYDEGDRERRLFCLWNTAKDDSFFW